MPCELTGTRLHAYLDGELDAAGASSFEHHLHSCTECTVALDSEHSLRRTISSHQLYEPTPVALRKKIVASLPGEAATRSMGFSFLPWAALAAALLFVVFGIQFVYSAKSRSDDATLASAAVDAHLRSLQPGHLMDVPSSDQHTVKPWFDGKVDFAPTVRDFADSGFPLLGGRLDVLSGRNSAALIYGRRKHVINVFILEASAQQQPEVSGTEHGYHWLSWQQNGFHYIAVSDVAAPDLDQLRDLLQKQ